MKTFKLKIDLPTIEEIADGLDERALHPALGRAEAAAAASESDLAREREAFRAADLEVAALPERIRRGDAAADTLDAALRRRQACALTIAPAERALADAEARLPTVRAAARQALEREVACRKEILERAAAQLVPALEALAELDHALAQRCDARDVTVGITWPCSLPDQLIINGMRGDLYSVNTAGVQAHQRHALPGET